MDDDDDVLGYYSYENEYEENSQTILRYKPRPIEELVKETRFTRKEIQYMYRGFKQECPSGIVTEQMFKEIYSHFFPQGECSNYARLIFATLDQNSDGTANFEDFLVGLSILSRGTIDEKLRWIFSLYDINKDGKVTKEELLLVITSIYELMGKFTKPQFDENAPRQHVEVVFKKFNSKQDGVITIEDFMQTCYNDESILNSMSTLDTVF
ncbi:Kv channel-interacting 2 isoform X7 [Brachionus plicatilis]|uniref:Kv channel-interacting 2 isoform X7 n=1 Tax=Brachionus plicatilis TaxID=10195 RepID=A0A3M7RD72_BRAPC|nr:Kv channel-interacting 2 isoform X7 [Brachionus plicatilis]